MTITEAEARRREREAVKTFSDYLTEWRADLNTIPATLRIWLDRNYPEIPTPAPAKELETEPEFNVLSWADLNEYLNILTARVRECEAEIRSLASLNSLIDRVPRSSPRSPFSIPSPTEVTMARLKIGEIDAEDTLDIDERYAPLPAPAPAKEPEAVQVLAAAVTHCLDNIKHELDALTARVRALEGK